MSYVFPISQTLTARGSFVALATPFDCKGRIDWKCIEKLALWHLEEGTEGLVCCGATGEGMTISEGEKKRMVSTCVDAVRNKIPIIINTGTADTRQSVRLTEQMLKLGASGCLVVTPYYNKPTPRGCVCHFSEIAKVGLPVIVYNNPGRVSVRLEAETVAELAKIPGIAGYKDSTADIALIRKIRKLCSIPILSGDDHLTYETLWEGGMGAISVIGNLFPRVWKTMISSALEKKWVHAKEISDRFQPLCKAMFLEPNPQCLKFAMSFLGKCQEHLRLPLVVPTEETQAEIKEEIVRLQRTSV
jgi:4-hydroxy-tetrahydrodipicolinate synthase